MSYRKINPLCIYHKDCIDGFTAAWVVNKYFGKGVAEFHPRAYGEAPPVVKGKDVIIVDFSFSHPVLSKMAESADSVIVIDHHKSAEQDLAGVYNFDRQEGYYNFVYGITGENVKWPNLVKIYDMQKCGAGLTWDFLFRGHEPPEMLRSVEDYDLWKFEMEQTRAVHEILALTDMDFASWNMVMADSIARVHQQGIPLLKKFNKDLADLLQTTKRRMKIAHHVVWVANVPYMYASQGGNILSMNEPFAATYFDTPQGRRFSLRSQKNALDVSEIARMYGGGGHTHAAGFTLPYERLQEFDL